MTDFEILETTGVDSVCCRVGRRTMDIRATREQLEQLKAGAHPIQAVLPLATPDQREFLISGILPEEWDELFAEHDDAGPEKGIDAEPDPSWVLKEEEPSVNPYGPGGAK